MNNITHKTSFLQALSEIKFHSHRKLLNYILYLSQKLPIVCMSEERLGAHISVKRQQAHKILLKFERLGLMKIDRRDFKTSIYKVNKFFKLLASQLYHIGWSVKEWAKELWSKVFNKKRTRSIDLYINIPVYNNLHEKERQGCYKNIKRRIMKNLEISPALQKVTKSLNLSKWGQIKLICFPDEVLLKALECYQKYGTSVKDPFNYMFMYCKEHCSSAGIEIDWQQYYHLKEQYKMPDNPNFIAQIRPTYTTEMPPTDLSTEFMARKKEREERWKKDGKEDTFQESQKKLITDYPFPGKNT